VALKGWAKATGYNETMPRAICELRDASVVR
jgi:hypothetical protein